MKKIVLQGDEQNDRERQGYGFLESYSKAGQGSAYSRLNIVFDMVDAAAFDQGMTADRSPRHLSFVRIMSTSKRLDELFAIGEVAEEGEWFRVTLATRSGMPRAWILDAEGDYDGPIHASNLIGLERLAGSGAGTTLQAGSTVSLLRQWCTVAAPAPQAAHRQFPADLYVRIVDVGHANFSAIHNERAIRDSIVGYFDVGGPIFFHHHTLPEDFPEYRYIPEDGFVALSHWDFDHYSLALTKLMALQQLTWYAPDQPVGPNAARLQTLLGARLNLISAPVFDISGTLRMWRGTGAIHDRNNSGYVLTVPNRRGATLLTGDVSYAAIPAPAMANLAALCITHHGGSGAGGPPKPATGTAVAAVSFGMPNHYHHPNDAAIAEHAVAGWTVSPTYRAPAARGDVWLP